MRNIKNNDDGTVSYTDFMGRRQTISKKDYEEKVWLMGEELEIDVDYLLDREQLRGFLNGRLRYCFSEISENINNYWISSRTRIPKSTVSRIFNGEVLPSIPQFIKLCYVITHFIPDFDIWFLFDKKAPMKITKDYIPFENFRGVNFRGEVNLDFNMNN